PFTVYLTYRDSQTEVARLVTMLRRIDMPLDQISELLGLPDDERSAFVTRYREAEAERHARRQSLARFIEHAVAEGSLDGHGQPGSSRFEVSLRTVPYIAVLSSTRHTSAREMPVVIRFS